MVVVPASQCGARQQDMHPARNGRTRIPCVSWQLALPDEPEQGTLDYFNGLPGADFMTTAALYAFPWVKPGPGAFLDGEGLHRARSRATAAEDALVRETRPDPEVTAELSDKPAGNQAAEKRARGAEPDGFKPVRRAADKLDGFPAGFAHSGQFQGAKVVDGLCIDVE